MTVALLLIAHGSRQAAANDDLHALAARLRDGIYSIVEPAFLELAEPSIVQAGGRCVELGAASVIMLPYFLSAGVHVQRDLQACRNQLAAAFPAVRFMLAAPLGPHPLLDAIVLERAAVAEVFAKNRGV